MFNTVVSFACICYVSVCIWRIKYYYYYYHLLQHAADGEALKVRSAGRVSYVDRGAEPLYGGSLWSVITQH